MSYPHDPIPPVPVRAGYIAPTTKQSLEYTRREANRDAINLLTEGIMALHEDRFITPEHTSEFLEAACVMTDAYKVLELGTYSGFATLHLLRAIVGKEGGKVVSIDCRPAHDPEFFGRPEIAPWFQHIDGATPEALAQLVGQDFDLVFIDSDHSVEHCERELAALMSITHPGTVFLFHDCAKVPNRTPEQSPWNWIHNKVREGILEGCILPTAPQLDVDKTFGPDNKRYRPNLGVLIRPW